LVCGSTFLSKNDILVRLLLSFGLRESLIQGWSLVVTLPVVSFGTVNRCRHRHSRILSFSPVMWAFFWAIFSYWHIRLSIFALLLSGYNGMIARQIGLVRHRIFLHPCATRLGRGTVQVQRHGGYRAGWIAHLVIAQIVGNEHHAVVGSQRALMSLYQQGASTTTLDIVPSIQLVQLLRSVLRQLRMVQT
jgi:hypothetical protein